MEEIDVDVVLIGNSNDTLDRFLQMWIYGECSSYHIDSIAASAKYKASFSSSYWLSTPQYNSLKHRVTLAKSRLSKKYSMHIRVINMHDKFANYMTQRLNQMFPRQPGNSAHSDSNKDITFVVLNDCASHGRDYGEFVRSYLHNVNSWCRSYTKNARSNHLTFAITFQLTTCDSISHHSHNSSNLQKVEFPEVSFLELIENNSSSTEDYLRTIVDTYTKKHDLPTISQPLAFSITVQPFSGDSFPLKVQSNYTVKQLKETIVKKISSLNLYDIELLYHGKILKDEKTLAKSHILANGQIMAMTKAQAQEQAKSKEKANAERKVDEFGLNKREDLSTNTMPSSNALVSSIELPVLPMSITELVPANELSLPPLLAVPSFEPLPPLTVSSFAPPSPPQFVDTVFGSAKPTTTFADTFALTSSKPMALKSVKDYKNTDKDKKEKEQEQAYGGDNAYDLLGGETFQQRVQLSEQSARLDEQIEQIRDHELFIQPSSARSIAYDSPKNEAMLYHAALFDESINLLAVGGFAGSYQDEPQPKKGGKPSRARRSSAKKEMRRKQDMEMEQDMEIEMQEEGQGEKQKRKQIHMEEMLELKSGEIVNNAQLFLKKAEKLQRKAGCCRICCTRPNWTKWDKNKQAAKEVVDNIFADLENAYYLLADAASSTELVPYYYYGSVCIYTCVLFCKLLSKVILYPIIMALSVVVTLPSCYFLLIVRMNKVETDTKEVAHREIVLESESCCKRMKRLLWQLARALFMFGFLVGVPLLITLYIIPNHNYDNTVTIKAIGTYVFIILLLQAFGTYRALRSFQERNAKELLEKKTPKPQKFVWNVGTILTMALLLYEIFQFGVFASYV
ncbi:hypothetical protein RFI_22912, partial [Reticulomyxa filosa]